MRSVAAMVLLLAACASQQIGGDEMRAALANAVAAEQVAWIQNGARPAGVDSMLALTTIDARVDRVSYVSANEANVLATYKYTGRLSSGRQDTLTVHRSLHFVKNGGEWSLQSPQRVVVQAQH